MYAGWFGGYSEPSDYSAAEMPCNLRGIMLGAFFVVPYIAFLLVLPGVREKRIVTLIAFTITMFVGGVIVATMKYPGWTVGHARIMSQFRAHTRERMVSNLGVNVGLYQINVTLKYEKDVNEPTYFDGLVNDPTYSIRPNFSKLDYNEKFDISSVASMTEALRNAHYHGLPYPMLSVLEYFSLNQVAFDWGRHYRVAGHYTFALLSLSLSFWSLAVCFLLFLPHLYGGALLCTGLSTMGGMLIYLFVSPASLSICFVGEDGGKTELDMKFGWSFYLVIAESIVAILFGLFLMVLQHYKIYTISTFLDSQLDETVGPQTQKRRTMPESSIIGEDLANSLEVMRRSKHSPEGSTTSSEKQSSGIHSRSSYTETGSLRSSASFESVKSLTRSASNLTVHDPPPTSRKEITIEVSKL